MSRRRSIDYTSHYTYLIVRKSPVFINEEPADEDPDCSDAYEILSVETFEEMVEYTTKQPALYQISVYDSPEMTRLVISYESDTRPEPKEATKKAD